MPALVPLMPLWLAPPLFCRAHYYCRRHYYYAPRRLLLPPLISIICHYAITPCRLYIADDIIDYAAPPFIIFIDHHSHHSLS
jgi:hypothetical protein